MELQDIKTALIERLNKYAQTDFLTEDYVNSRETAKDILSTLIHDGYTQWFIEQNVFNGELLVEWFGEDMLKKNNVYVSGEVNIYGEKTCSIFGNCKATVFGGAIVCSYENASVTLHKCSELYAYGHTTFQAAGNSEVHIGSDTTSGTLYSEARAHVNGYKANLVCYEHSLVRAENACGFEMHDYSEIIATKNVHDIQLYEFAKASLWDGSSLVGNDKCDIALYDNSTAVAYGAKTVTCEDTSCADIYKDVRLTVLRDSGLCRIHEVGTKLRAYDSSTVQDFTSMYTETFDNAVIIDMPRHRVLCRNV